MCRYFCIRFIAFMFKGKSLTDFTNIFSWNIFKNNKLVLNYFSIETNKKMVFTVRQCHEI